jgi:hypothetical protein
MWFYASLMVPQDKWIYQKKRNRAKKPGFDLTITTVPIYGQYFDQKIVIDG